MSKPQELKPCEEYHPLPCGLDKLCGVPAEYFDPELSDEEVFENYVEDKNGT